jgi:Tol biopolymer transport system component
VSIQTTAVLSIRAAQLATTSAAGPTSISAGGNSFGPTISGDGRSVAFVSHAGNLVTNETLRESLQVFVRDLVTSNTVLVSVSTNGRGGLGNSISPVISSNGQFVAFASEADDLVDGDTNGVSDVFVRDLTSGITRLISADVSGHAPNDGLRASIIPHSGNPLISADGRWVFFESRATNLTQYADTNATTDVFVRDLQSNSNFLVSVSWGVNRASNGRSELASITPGGRRAAFISTSSDLVAPDGNPLGDVYVRDLDSLTTYRASRGLSNYASSYRCVRAALAENGQIVAFTAAMGLPSGTQTWLFRHDLAADTDVLIATNVIEYSRLHISAEGRYVVFENGTNVFHFDANTGTSELVNVTTTGAQPASGVARNPVATPDGSGIVFISNCPDLVTNSSTLFQIYARDMTAGTTRLITIATNGQPSVTNSEVSLLAVARDLSRVAFDSTTADLVEGDGNRASDVFVRELATQTTGLISQREPSRPRASGVAHAFIGRDCVSADGRFVAFSSDDNDLLPDDLNVRPDVFVRDMLTGTVVTPGISTNVARSPAISANGRYVTYLRRFPISLSQPTGGAVWRFDREAGTNELVSASSQRDPAISGDGNLVAFILGNNLVVRDMAQQTNYTVAPADPTSNRQPLFTPDGHFVLFKGTSASPGLYAWDSVRQQTQVVSGTSVSDLAVSGNSRFAVFTSFSGMYLADLVAGTNQLLQSGALKPAVNGDGTLIVFADNRSGNFLLALNRRTDETESIATEAGGGPLNTPLVSSDGRFVVYARRWSATYVGGDPHLTVNYTARLYVRDRKLGSTTLISATVEGSNANASVWQPVLAADGRTVVFHSVASDLVAGDYNDKSDIFVLKLGGADTDGDGMDDDWEVAYFGNLSRNGSGDFDGDGASDLAEFLAGTDPTNSGSVFRVLTVTPAGGGSTQLIWSGNPARNYRAEFKDDLGAANWTALSGAISWNGSTGSIIDTTAANSTHRYYRVVRLP